MKKTVKRLIIAGVVLIILVILAVLFLSRGKQGDVYTSVVIKKGDIIQTVSETGTVKSESEIDLSFENGGKLIKKYVDIGDKVKKGVVLAEVDHENLKIKKDEAQATLNSAKLELNKLLSGATSEDKAVSMANLQQANSAYVSAKKELVKITESVNQNIEQAQKALKDLESSEASDVTSVEQAVIVADTNLFNTKSNYQKAIDNSKDSAIVTADKNIAATDIALDALDQIINEKDYEDVYGVKNSVIAEKSENDYNDALDYQTIVKTTFANASANRSDQNVSILLNNTKKYLDLVFTTSQSCHEALEESITNSTFTQTILDSLKTIVSTKQTVVSTGISSVEASKQGLDTTILNYKNYVNAAEESVTQAKAALNDAKIRARNVLSNAKTSGAQQLTSAQSRVDATLKNVELAEAQRDKVLAPANSYDVALLKAKVKQAEVSMESVSNNIDKSFIKAPIDGMITKVNFEVGEQIGMGVPVISMLGENNFKIDVLISEADIAKVNTNDPVEVTFDAYGDDTKFAGKIYFIEPAETKIQDVIYYLIKINFNAEKYNIKSGMTANVVITTDSIHDAVIVPSRAIIDKGNSGKFVKILSGTEAVEKKVEIGLRGDGGLVEIVSGVVPGEKVITYTKTSK